MRSLLTRRLLLANIVMMARITTTSTAAMIIITVTAMLTKPGKPASQGGDCGDMSGSEAAALYRLMTWLSPGFPVGAFSYSSGIEWAVESGDIAEGRLPPPRAPRRAGGGCGFL